MPCLKPAAKHGISCVGYIQRSTLGYQLSFKFEQDFRRVKNVIAPNTEIRVIHAFVQPFDGEFRLPDVLDDEIQKYCAEARQHALNRIGALLGGADDSQHRFFQIVEQGDASRLILAKEAELQTDLIVMGKHGHSIAEEMLLGSVTRHILADSKCDVLIVHYVG